MAEQNEPLSERELEILRLVATGAANKEIAYRLVISPNTVKVHLRNIFSKIGVASRTEATLYAIKIGLVQPQRVPSADQQPPPEVEPGEQGAASAALAPAAASRRLISWQWAAGAVFGLLLLVAAAVAGWRMIAPPQVTPTIAAESVVLPPPSQRWTEKASLPEARKGMGYAEYDNSFFLVGGETAAGPDGVLLRYIPGSDSWERLESKPAAVSEVKAALLGEKIYVPGGRLPDGTASDALEAYDLRTGSWESLANVPAALWGYALAAYEGQLYLFGGRDSQQYYSSVYAYLPQEDRWESRTPLSAARAYASAVVVGNKIHLLGGFDGERVLDLNEAYFPTRDGSDEPAWEAFAPLPAPSYAMGSTYLAGLVFLAGGVGEDPAAARGAAGLQYLAQMDRWFEFEAPPRPPGALPAMLAAGNFIHLLGGGEASAGLEDDHQAYQAIYIISVPLLQQEE